MCSKAVYATVNVFLFCQLEQSSLLSNTYEQDLAMLEFSTLLKHRNKSSKPTTRPQQTNSLKKYLFLVIRRFLTLFGMEQCLHRLLWGRKEERGRGAIFSITAKQLKQEHTLKLQRKIWSKLNQIASNFKNPQNWMLCSNDKTICLLTDSIHGQICLLN